MIRDTWWLPPFHPGVAARWYDHRPQQHAPAFSLQRVKPWLARTLQAVGPFRRAFPRSQCEACLCQDLRQDTSVQPADRRFGKFNKFAETHPQWPTPTIPTQQIVVFYPKHHQTSRGPSGTIRYQDQNISKLWSFGVAKFRTCLPLLSSACSTHWCSECDSPPG
jgi:hypothetical protein